jgi:hypothetical protein
LRKKKGEEKAVAVGKRRLAMFKDAFIVLPGLTGTAHRCPGHRSRAVGRYREEKLEEGCHSL